MVRQTRLYFVVFMEEVSWILMRFGLLIVHVYWSFQKRENTCGNGGGNLCKSGSRFVVESEDFVFGLVL